MTDTIKMRPMLVEFVGASGVGKSFLAARIYDELIQRNVSVAELQSIRIMRNSVRDSLIVVQTALATLLLKPEKLSIYVGSVKRLAKYNIRKRSCESGHDVYICDEGIFQMLRSLYRNSRSHSMTDIAERLFKLVSLPDIVVVVEAGIEEIFARRTDRNRQNDSFSRQSVKQDVLLLEDTIMAIKHVQRFPKTNMQMIVLDVEKDDVETVVEKAVSFVQARLARA